MRILISWLRDFVTPPVEPVELASLLTMRGFELAALEPVASRDGSDAVIDLEVTPNRPDCLSVIGIAREVAVAYGLPLTNPTADEHAAVRLERDQGEAKLNVTLEDSALCPRYSAALADVVTGPSPSWLAGRLHAAGIRPINNVVDVTNYVMLELGHPMHAFDYEKLDGGELRIRRARTGERLRTLDGQERALRSDMLVIADRTKPQAIGGVMGGAASEVGATTRRVALESAYFNPASIRRTRRELGLSTEASYRFERGMDIAAPVSALTRAARLLEQIGAGRVTEPFIDRYAAPRQPVRIPFRSDRLTKILGQHVEGDLVLRILESLGFVVLDAGRNNGHIWTIEVPTRRVDVAREEDLIEEVARHYGYDRLPTTLPASRTVPPATSPIIDENRTIRRVLTAAGFSEAMTLTFIERAPAELFAMPAELVPLANPLSEKFAVLRPSLLPGLLESLAHNRRRERHDVRLFELGNVFRQKTGECRSVAFVWSGLAGSGHWSGSHRPVDFFDIKGVVEEILDGLKVTPKFHNESISYLEAGRGAEIVSGVPAPDASATVTRLGTIGQLAAPLAEPLGIDGSQPIYVAELDLDLIRRTVSATSVDDGRFQPLPRFPSVTRDLSIIVDEALPAAAVRETILASASGFLHGLREFDRYRGEGVPTGRVSLSFRLRFRSPERTLTDEEVQREFERIVQALRKKHDAVQR